MNVKNVIDKKVFSFLQVPIPCTLNHQRFKAMKWIIESCRDKERKLPMEVKLSLELLDAYNNQVREFSSQIAMLMMLTFYLPSI